MHFSMLLGRGYMSRLCFFDKSGITKKIISHDVGIYMKLDKLVFDEKGFRRLKNLTIKIAPRITLIAGHNGVGKSTILGILANGSELRGQKTLLDKPFRAEFSEIFFLDYYGDFKERENPNSATLVYLAENNECVYKDCSVTGSQKRLINKKQYKRFMGEVDVNGLTDKQRADIDKMKEKHPNEDFIYIPRMRVIPRTDKENSSQTKNFLEDNNVGNSAKLQIPTIYLGMSRVSPIGEFDQQDITLKSRNISKDTIEYIYKFFDKIVPSVTRKDEQNIMSHTFGKNKKASLVPAFKHSSLSMSLGQDSLSSIISAFASFFQLEKDLGDKYKGGILIIDEIEAGLHPNTQLRLISEIQKQAKKLKLQVIATTHSLTVIKEVLKAAENQGKSSKIMDSVVYLMDTRLPRVMLEPDYTKIKSDMLLIDINQKKEPLKVYFEDDEAKYFFEQVLKYKDINLKTDFRIELDLISLKIGCEILIKLAKADTYFKTAVLVLDNDVVTREQNRTFLEGNKNSCALPASAQVLVNSNGKQRTPEGLIYDFLLDKLNNYESNYDFWSSLGSYTTDFVEHNILNLSKDERNNREEMKKWFKRQEQFFERVDILQKWCKLNEKQIDEFIENFKIAVNSACQNLDISKFKNQGRSR